LALPLLAVGLGLAPVSPAQAQATVSHFDIVFTFPPEEGTNPCTGTTDTLDSQLRVLSQATFDPTSGIETVEGFNVTEVRGDVLFGSSLSSFHISHDVSDNAPFIVNQVARLVIQEPGAADNAHQTFFLHLTINANGEPVSATMELGPVECRG
jgi:hypothetical protein